MERLLQRFETSDKALKTLEEIYAFDHPTPLERDAFIQRFEYTYESIWKLGKQYLRDIEGPLKGLFVRVEK
ncbi:nucleotidyltransferase substrate binding protein [Bacillus sp. FJAT-44742]|uniref:nucleotidyltransferase substrate binding protein n=1 Tax=Bacillus sp. FJAT-44742 TaxID=2014005 RepID=UPI0018E1F3AC|nr:nucleotidyltransferase substrate binding protein [Bacillus sp. FJAT-44742]